MCAKSLQSCPTLCSPMDCSLTGSSVHAILQAKILGWIATPSSEDLPNPGIRPTSSVAPELQADSLPLSHWGSPTVGHIAIITAVIMWLFNTDQLDSPKSELFVPSILFPHLLTLLLLDTTHSPGRHLIYSLLLITSKAHPHWPQIHLNQFKW